MGGLNTVFLATFFGYAGSTFGLTSSTTLVKPLMSGPGLASLAKGTILKAGPAGFGFLVGIQAFGNGPELRQLIRNAGTYRSEFKQIQKEHYY